MANEQTALRGYKYIWTTLSFESEDSMESAAAFSAEKRIKRSRENLISTRVTVKFDGLTVTRTPKTVKNSTNSELKARLSENAELERLPLIFF